jgi:hypothetical protein
MSDGTDTEMPAPDAIDNEDRKPSETQAERQVPMSNKMPGLWMTAADDIVRQETNDQGRERLERYRRDDPSIDHYNVYVDQLRRREESGRIVLRRRIYSEDIH